MKSDCMDKVSLSKKSKLPLVALILCLSPVWLLLIAALGYELQDIVIFGLLLGLVNTIMQFTIMGGILSIAGTIIAIIALCKRKNSSIISVVAICLALLLLFMIGYVGWLMNQGLFP